MRAIDKLVLGTAQFGMNYGINNKTGLPPTEKVNEILLTASNKGIKFLDTAEVYGSSHDVIGDFHKNYPNKRFEIITKLPSFDSKGFLDKIRFYLNQLGVSSISVLMHHSFNDYKSNRAGLSKAIQELKEVRLIKKFGVSVYSNDEVQQAIDDDLIEFIQLPFNILDNKLKRGLFLDAAKSKGKTIQIRSVFLQGLFFTNRDAEIPILNDLRKYLKVIDIISEKSGYSIEQLALGYCLHQNLIDLVTIGVDNLEQIERNLSFSYESIPESLYKELDEINVLNENLLNPALWKPKK